MITFIQMERKWWLPRAGRKSNAELLFRGYQCPFCRQNRIQQREGGDGHASVGARSVPLNCTPTNSSRRCVFTIENILNEKKKKAHMALKIKMKFALDKSWWVCVS